MFFTPSIELTTFSIGLMTSFSIASGEAPGYCTVMYTCGMLISGICSTGSSRYENRPSTTSASMTMVAKTGWLMLVRVIHMAESRATLTACERPGRTDVRVAARLASPRTTRRTGLASPMIGDDHAIACRRPSRTSTKAAAFDALRPASTVVRTILPSCSVKT